MFSIFKSLVSFVRLSPVVKPLLNDQVTGQDSPPAFSKRSPSSNSSEGTRKLGQPLSNHSIDSSQVVPFDEDLLERAKTQWQFGDWESLAEIDRTTLQHHPDRGKLALLAAAGHQQLGDIAQARRFTELARDWGCSPRLVSQILISGVHQSLGNLGLLTGQVKRFSDHIESAISCGASGADIKLVAGLRATNSAKAIQFLDGNTREELVGVTSFKLGSIGSNISEQRLKQNIKAEIQSDLRANNPNPYAHNRTLTPALNKALRDFASQQLGLTEVKPAYIDYLATKAIQVEKSCVGRLATTVQDAVARQLVAECVQSAEKIVILEIGALYGISLAILYNHAVTRFPSVRVVCLDPFDGYYGKAIDAVLNQPVNDLTFHRNMTLANVPKDDYQVIKRYSNDPEAIESAKQLGIDLLIIDGDHSYEGVKFDFDNYFPFVKPGGYVVLDDYNAKEWPGVQQFVDEDLPKVSGYWHLGSISRTAVGRRGDG